MPGPNASITATRDFLAIANVTWFTEKAVKPITAVSMPFLDNLGTPKTEPGFYWMFPFSAGDHSTITYIDSGLEQVNMTVSTVNQFGQDYARCYVAPCIITEKEIRMLSGVSKQSMWKQRLAAVQNMIMRDAHKAFMGINGALCSAFNKLNGQDFANGFLEALAVGSQVRTIHGISKITYATAQRWNNSFYDCTASASTKLADAFDALGIRAALVGGKSKANMKGCAYYGSENGVRNASKVLRSKEQYTTRDMRDDALGNWSFSVAGIPVYPTLDMPANAGLATATKPVSFYLVDHGKIQFVALAQTEYPEGVGNKQSLTSAPRWFTNTGVLKHPHNGYQYFWDLIGIEGNLVACEPNYDTLDISRCGVIVDAEAY